MARTILITGASAGLGRAMAWEFARRGYDLALAARQLKVLQELRDELAARHPVRVQIHALDVSDVESVRHTIDAAAEELDGLDVVVANAGTGAFGRAGRQDLSAVKKMIDVNVTGAIATIDAAIAHFRKRGRGHIVAMSSVSAWRGLPGSGAYSASKAALDTYMDAVRTENRGEIKTTVIHAGFIDTAINAKVKSRPFLLTLEEGGKQLADAVERGRRSAVIPAFPWRVLFPILKILPSALMARAF